MASKRFEIRTEPHEAHIGNDTLLFEPEVEGAVFAQAYAEVRELQLKVQSLKAQKGNSQKPAKAETINPAVLTDLSLGMRAFVRSFLLPESTPLYDAMRLPDRVLGELMQFAAELYGGGSGNPDAAGGTSTG
jgi:aconitase A